MTVAEALQIAIDNEKNTEAKRIYRKWYENMTIEQASVQFTEKEKQKWLKKHRG